MMFPRLPTAGMKTQMPPKSDLEFGILNFRFEVPPFPCVKIHPDFEGHFIDTCSVMWAQARVGLRSLRRRHENDRWLLSAGDFRHTCRLFYIEWTSRATLHWLSLELISCSAAYQLLLLYIYIIKDIRLITSLMTPVKPAGYCPIKRMCSVWMARVPKFELPGLAWAAAPSSVRRCAPTETSLLTPRPSFFHFDAAHLPPTSRKC